MSNYSLMFKYIIIGDTGVGKSSILLQLIENEIREQHDATIGVEFGAKIIKVNGMNIKLQIWDTAGQENFRSIIRSYYRSAIGALLVYDITNKNSFHNLQRWMEEIKNNGNANMVIVLCGNKIDLESEQLALILQGWQYAQSQSLIFLEISAKQGINVQSAFYQSTQRILQEIDDQKILLGQDPGIKIGGQYKKRDKEIQVINTYEEAVQLKTIDTPNGNNCC
uniref:Rab_A39 protein n=1 Tax=Paramecium tetraurelia TaxID=5888 RepID=Q3SDJ4_PARTE|nr:rab_A39 [Paramecium tetraurelia]